MAAKHPTPFKGFHSYFPLSRSFAHAHSRAISKHLKSKMHSQSIHRHSTPYFIRNIACICIFHFVVVTQCFVLMRKWKKKITSIFAFELAILRSFSLCRPKHYEYFSYKKGPISFMQCRKVYKKRGE